MRWRSAFASEFAQGGAELGTSDFRGGRLPGNLLHGGLSGFEPRESSRGRFDRHLKFQEGSGPRPLPMPEADAASEVTKVSSDFEVKLYVDWYVLRQSDANDHLPTWKDRFR